MASEKHARKGFKSFIALIMVLCWARHTWGDNVTINGSAHEWDTSRATTLRSITKVPAGIENRSHLLKLHSVLSRSTEKGGPGSRSISTKNTTSSWKRIFITGSFPNHSNKALWINWTFPKREVNIHTNLLIDPYLTTTKIYSQALLNTASKIPPHVRDPKRCGLSTSLVFILYIFWFHAHSC